MLRGRALSEDVNGILSHVRRTFNLNATEASRITGIGRRTVQRRFRPQQPSQDSIEKNGRGQPKKLSELDVAYLIGLIEQDPSIHLDELQRMLEVNRDKRVSVPTIWRALNKEGYTMKQISKKAKERCAIRRQEYRLRVSQYRAEQLVFCDESADDRQTMVRERAWAKKGERASRNCFFIGGKRYSVLPALGREGILYCHVLEGSFNGATFTDFISGVLNKMQPYPAPNSVLVMDNCSTHKNAEIRRLVEARGCRLEYLPSYSPDFNPIEYSFSRMKAIIRREGQITRDDDPPLLIYERLLRIAFSITPGISRQYFRACGYF